MVTMLHMLSRNWWVFIVRGVIAIVFGLLVWIWPDLSLTAMIWLFGAYALGSGIMSVITGIASIGENRRWWAELLLGIASIAAGVIAVVWPDLTALALLYVIASWAIVAGVFEIAAAIELRKSIENEWFLGLSGLISIIFGVLLFLFPGSGALGILWLIGAYAIFFGVLLIIFGFRIRTLRDDLSQLAGDRAQPGA